ncbi:hypothetical protein ACSBR1_039173 [Camellia fascicularis]
MQIYCWRTWENQAKSIAAQKLQVRSVATPAKAVAGLDEMVSGTQRKYYYWAGTEKSVYDLLQFAFTHCIKDLAGGTLVPVHGLDSPLYALEINSNKAREEFRTAGQKHSGSGVRDPIDSMGLEILAEQLGELKLDEMLDTPQPGLNEAIAISKACIVNNRFFGCKDGSESMFTRIVLDTATTGHTLQLLSLPDFMDASIGKMMKLKTKITSATSVIKSVFGKQETQLGLDTVSIKLVCESSLVEL